MWNLFIVGTAGLLVGFILGFAYSVFRIPTALAKMTPLQLSNLASAVALMREKVDQ